MFDPFLAKLHESIQDHGGKELELPFQFRKCSSKKGKSTIRSWLWRVPGFRRWRVTRLDSGERMQVLNTVAYPSYNRDIPIMGIDLLWFGIKRKLVAVLDFQPLIQDEDYFNKYFAGLKTLRNDFPEFNSKEDISLYDPNKYFSPWVFFYRGNKSSVKELLPNAFSSFIDCYWELNHNTLSSSPNYGLVDVRQLHISYDRYSAEKDPAHSLFSGFFGKEWSDKYLSEFLFPLSSDESTKNN